MYVEFNCLFIIMSMNLSMNSESLHQFMIYMQ